MKKLFVFIVELFSIIRNFFFGKKEVKKNVVKEANSSLADEMERKGFLSRRGGPTVPKHNNRKTHEGRKVQYINMGDGRTRPIYHSAK